jgi:DedD protein
MAGTLEPDRDDRGFSARQLVLMFLAGVAVCAVFFAAGFLVGYNERASKASPATESVTPSGAIPPMVNPPLKASSPPPQKVPGAKPPDASLTEEAVPAGETSSGSATAENKEAAGKQSSAQAPQGLGGWVIQVVASTAPEDAEKAARVLQGLGFPAFVVPPQKDGGKVYRVQVGPYNSREGAEKARARLVQQGFKQAFIRH